MGTLLDISEVASLLKAVSGEVFSGRGKLCLSTNYLYKLNKAFEENIIEETNLSFDIVQTSNTKTNYIRDLKFLLDLVQRTVSLKIIPDVVKEFSNVDITRFKNIKVLEIQKVKIILVNGLQRIRPQLQELIVCHSINSLSDVLSECGGDNSQPYNWNELKKANFSHNNILSVDDCLDYTIFLQCLDLSYNVINKLDFINNLPNLKYLNVSYNKLDKVPRFKGQICNRLQVLILRNNFIEDLTDLTTLSNLEQLDLSHNCLLEHKRLLSISHLISLRWLNVQGNPISFHPQHRNLTCNYLNKNSSTVKFVLDNIVLTKTEKSLTGSLYPIFQIAHLSVSSHNSADECTNDYIQDRTRRVRNVTIEDANSVKEDNVPIAASTPSTSFQHLQLKKQVEQLREEYGESWLYRHSGMMVQDVLGFQKPSVVSLTPYESAVDSLYIGNDSKDVTSDSGDFKTVNSQLQSTTGTDEEEFQTVNEEEPSIYNETKPTEENESDVSDGEDIFAGGEECIYLATNTTDSEQVFVVLTETHISERDVTTSKERARWHINTIHSCTKMEDNDTVIKIEFDTLRRDRKQRIFELDREEVGNFYDSIQERIAKTSESIDKKKMYQCMKCSELFPEQSKNALLEESIVTCPKCKSNLVVEH